MTKPSNLESIPFESYHSGSTSDHTTDGFTKPDINNYVVKDRYSQIEPRTRVDLNDTHLRELLCTGIIGVPVNSRATVFDEVIRRHLEQLSLVADADIVPVFSIPFSHNFTPLQMLMFYNSGKQGDPIQFKEEDIRSIPLAEYNSRERRDIDEKEGSSPQTRQIADLALLGVKPEKESFDDRHSSRWGYANFSDYLQMQWLLRRLGLPQVDGHFNLTPLNGRVRLAASSNDWSIRLHHVSDDYYNNLQVVSL